MTTSLIDRQRWQTQNVDPDFADKADRLATGSRTSGLCMLNPDLVAPRHPRCDDQLRQVRPTTVPNSSGVWFGALSDCVESAVTGTPGPHRPPGPPADRGAHPSWCWA